MIRLGVLSETFIRTGFMRMVLGSLVSLIVLFALIPQAALAVDQTNESTEVLSLAGKWEFYWQQLLEPADFRRADFQDATAKLNKPSPDYIQVPSSWIGQSLGKQTNDGRPLPRFGYATYRTTLQVAPNQVGVNTALLFRYIGSAFRIWIDGKEYEGLGVVGTRADREQPRIAMQIFYFTPTAQTVEIIIQVSNYSFRDAGIVGEPRWAPTHLMTSHVFLNIALQDVAFTSFFFLLGIYHLIVFLSRRNERSFLWLGILNLCLAIRTLLVSEYLTMLVIPGIKWEHIIYIEYIVEAIAVTSLILFFHVLYPKDTHRWMLWITFTYTTIVLVYVTMASTAQFTSTMFLHWLIWLAILSYYFIYIGIVTIIRRREGAYLNMLGLFLVIFGIFHDLLLYTGIIESVPLTSLTLMAFFFIQAMIVAFRYSNMFRHNVHLRNEMATMNAQLEQTVSERTEQLRQSVEQLTEVDVKRAQLLENIAHDMGSPVAGLQTQIYAMKHRQLTVEQQTRVLLQMQTNVENLRRQSEDLYDLMGIDRNSDAVEVQHLSVHELWQLIHAFLEEKVEWEQITLKLGEITKSTIRMMHVNPYSIIRVVQNFLDNAIKFSMKEPCPIEVEYFVREEHVVFALTDFGNGIAADEMGRVFERFFKGAGNRKGIGLGLAISKEIIERQGGQVGVRSELGQGSTFWFTIPLIAEKGL